MSERQKIFAQVRDLIAQKQYAKARELLLPYQDQAKVKEALHKIEQYLAAETVTTKPRVANLHKNNARAKKRLGRLFLLTSLITLGIIAVVILVGFIVLGGLEQNDPLYGATTLHGTNIGIETHIVQTSTAQALTPSSSLSPSQINADQEEAE